MSKRLYVGNLSYDTTEETLKSLFSNYGEIFSLEIMKDRETGLSKGFGFADVEEEKFERIIGGTNGKEIDGRRIRVSESRARREHRRFDGDNSAPRRERRGFGDEGFVRHERSADDDHKKFGDEGFDGRNRRRSSFEGRRSFGENRSGERRERGDRGEHRFGERRDFDRKRKFDYESRPSSGERNFGFRGDRRNSEEKIPDNEF